MFGCPLAADGLDSIQRVENGLRAPIAIKDDNSVELAAGGSTARRMLP
jgi:hypothetical protein